MSYSNIPEAKLSSLLEQNFVHQFKVGIKYAQTTALTLSERNYLFHKKCGLKSLVVGYENKITCFIKLKVYHFYS